VTEFWIAQVPHPTNYRLRKTEIVNSGDFTVFSTTGPRAILWLSEECVVSVRIPTDGDPELILGLGGKVALRGWQGGRAVFKRALSVREGAPVVRAGYFSVQVERREDSGSDASYLVIIV
jgi:hypothetical protein